MIIQLNADFRITTDPMNWLLQSRAKPKKASSKVRWDNVGYFATLDSLLLNLAQRRVRFHDGDYGPDAVEVLVKGFDEMKALTAELMGQLPSPATPKNVLGRAA